MRTILSCTLLLVAYTGLSADDKKGEKFDAAKLVGKWEPKEKGVQPLRVEFTKDGKVTFDPLAKGGLVLEGTYKLDGDKLTITMTFDPKQVLTNTLTKLTDTELSIADEKGKEKTLLRVKDK
jgi:uncharacterized protein (TIGR03066 family)